MRKKYLLKYQDLLDELETLKKQEDEANAKVYGNDEEFNVDALDP